MVSTAEAPVVELATAAAPAVLSPQEVLHQLITNFLEERPQCDGCHVIGAATWQEQNGSEVGMRIAIHSVEQLEPEAAECKGSTPNPYNSAASMCGRHRFPVKSVEAWKG